MLAKGNASSPALCKRPAGHRASACAPEPNRHGQVHIGAPTPTRNTQQAPSQVPAASLRRESADRLTQQPGHANSGNGRRLPAHAARKFSSSPFAQPVALVQVEIGAKRWTREAPARSSFDEMKVVAKGQLPAYTIGRTARRTGTHGQGQEPLPSFESVLRAVFSEFDLKTLGTKKAEPEKQRPCSAFAEAPRRGHRPSSATFIPMGHVRAPWPSDRCFPPSSSLQESAMLLNAEHSLRRVRPLSAGPTRPISAPVARQLKL